MQNGIQDRDISYRHIEKILEVTPKMSLIDKNNMKK